MRDIDFPYNFDIESAREFVKRIGTGELHGGQMDSPRLAHTQIKLLDFFYSDDFLDGVTPLEFAKELKISVGCARSRLRLMMHRGFLEVVGRNPQAYDLTALGAQTYYNCYKYYLVARKGAKADGRIKNPVTQEG